MPHAPSISILVGALVASVVAPSSAAAYDKSAFVAPEGQALVVFIQNLHVDRKMTFTVFGSDKRCIAEVGGREAQILPTAPGPYLFYVLGYGKTRRIELYTEPGRTYFIRLHTVEKLMGQVPEVTLVRRGSESHKLLKFRLEGAMVTHTKDNKRCYGMPLKERTNRTQRRLNEANADWKNAKDIVRDNDTLIEKDGLTADDISRL
jgi:hypothetical protein